MEGRHERELLKEGARIQSRYDGWLSVCHTTTQSPPFTLSLLCTTQSGCFLCISPLRSFLLWTPAPSSSSQLSHPPAQDGRSDEGSCRCLAGLGTGTAPQEHNRLRQPTESVLVLQRRVPAVPASLQTTAMLQLRPDDAGGDDGEAAIDPVHPGHGRADDPGRAADQVPGRHQRHGHLLVRAAVGVRLVGGAGGHHGVLHDRRGGRPAVGGRERQVREREAGADRGQIRDAHAPGVGQVHALHGALLPGQRPPVRQELVVTVAERSGWPGRRRTSDHCLVL